MATKLYIIATLLITAMASIFSTCKKGGLGCANTLYNFKIFEDVHPDKDSIRISDTIFLKVSAPNRLVDMQSGKIIEYSGAANLGNVVTLLRFLPENTVQGAIDNFNFKLLQGMETNAIDPLSQKDFLFVEEKEYYKFNLAIIPKHQGKYVLTIGNAANVFRKTDKCTKASFEINIDSTDQHF